MTHTEVDLFRAEAALFPSRGPHSDPLPDSTMRLVKRAADLLAAQRVELTSQQPVKTSAVEQLAQAVLDGQLRFHYDTYEAHWAVWTDR